MASIVKPVEANLGQLPFGRTQFMRVAFTTANQDVAVSHNLKPTAPDQVGYIVVQQSAAGSVYIDSTASRRVWTTTSLYVRSNTANLVATLLLFTPTFTMTAVNPV
jgi:hypothetical protein